MSETTVNVSAPPWNPSTPPIDDAALGSSEIVVVHYWAIWNAHDRAMDKQLAAVRDDYAGRIGFYSCDTDRSFIEGIANIPALGCFIAGERSAILVGLRSEGELRLVLDEWLDAQRDAVTRKLNYRPPAADAQPASGWLVWAIIASLVEHAAILLTYGTALDDGHSEKNCLIVSAAYWLVAISIIIFRRDRLCRSDLWFIAIGYPAMLISCVIARG